MLLSAVILSLDFNEMFLPFSRALDCYLAIINSRLTSEASERSNSLPEKDYYRHYFVLSIAALSRKYKLFILLC